MTNETETALANLACDITIRLDRLHDELLAKLRTMARQTGQFTRLDRL